jgi:hypothetical protein
MQVFKVLTIIKVKVICIQSESGLHQPMKAKVGLTICKTIKQISKEEGKTLMSSFKNSPDACYRKGLWKMEKHFSIHHHPISKLSPYL